jgi:tripartite-type tricarboxylate transporter receptor subunit TctC
MAFTAPAGAQPYPSRPVRIIIGFLPGGSTDIMVRLVTPALIDAFQQQFIVDNRPGANSNIGNEAAAKSAPDGYTLLGVSASFSINVSLYPKMGYHPVRDFSPITRIAAVHNVLVVHPSIPAKTVKELVSLIKRRPGELVFASSGSGSTSHLAMELLKTSVGGLDALHVPYKSGPPALLDLVSGQGHMLVATMPSTLPYVQSGRLRALAVASLKRAEAMPTVPTFIESGYPGFEVAAWNALLAPKGTPSEIISRVNTAVVKALRTPQAKEKFAVLGAEIVGDSPEQFGAYLQNEVSKWARVIKASGAKLE